MLLFDSLFFKRRGGDLLCITLIILAALCFRLAYLNVYTLSWDEWTFMIMGNDVVDGNLLYKNLWDVKPPLLFYAFALPLWFSSTEIFPIRLMGFTSVAISGVLVYLMAKKAMTRTFAVISAITVAAYLSYRTPWVTSEHVAIPFMLSAIWLCTKTDKNRVLLHFIIGAFFGAAVLTRMNLAFLVLVVGFFLLIKDSFSRSFLISLRRSVIMAFGFFFSALVICLPHIYSGELTLVYDAMIRAPLSYSTEQQSLLGIIESRLSPGNSGITSEYMFHIIVHVSGFIGVVGTIMLSKLRRNLAIQITLAALVGVELSIFLGGRFFNHYFLQSYAFVFILFFATLHEVCSHISSAVIKKYCIRVAYVCSCLYICLIVGFEVKKELNRDIARDAELDAARDFLEENLDDNDRIVLLDLHILHVILDKPILRASLTHPTNITREFLLQFMYSAEENFDDELAVIMNMNPDYILVNSSSWHRVLADPVLQHMQSKSYEKVYKSNEYEIYHLINGDEKNTQS